MSILSSWRRRRPAHVGRVWVAVLALTMVAAGGTASASPTPSPTGSPTAHPTARDCDTPSGPHEMVCLAVHRTDVQAKKGLLAPQVTPGGYGPGSLQDAYALPSATAGAGQTVAIIDAYDNPQAEADLSVYRAQYGLPACTTANGCFRKVDQRGGTNYPAPNTDWSGEISLDLDMVSAVCPSCNILLVEADDPGFDSLGIAVDEAVALGAKYVSNSYGDSSGENPDDLGYNTYYDHPGIVITASSGDWGYGAIYPASAPGVTAVGGTSLRQDGSGNWSESVWNGAGSGCSRYQDKPAWQSDSGCARRTVSDVSAVADPNTGVAVYNAYGLGGWAVYGGTSASSPIIAATYALAGAPQAGTNPAQYPYDSRTVAATQEINDVSGGSNGTCSSAYLCTGVEGYDGPTGLGSPHGVGAFTYREHGHISGTVKDSVTGKPIVSAKVQASDRVATTDAQGHYDLDLPAATYQVSATVYGYDPAPVSVIVTAGTTTTQDLPLVARPRASVSGKVTDGSGHGWPLYAKVTSSDGSTTFTDPVTGEYSLSLLQHADFTLHFTPVDTGYQPVDETVSVGTTNVTQNVASTVAIACTAPGYQAEHIGATQAFDTSKAPSGWKVTNTDLQLPGYGYQPGWVFNNPAARPNNTGADGNFAIVDSDHSGQHNIQNTQLTSPVVDLSSAATPAVEFASDLQAAVNSRATVDVSTDGGATWANVWSSIGTSNPPAPGQVVVQLPQAAHKSQVQVRFGYVGQWSKWWGIDNVFLGNRVCTAQTGGLVVGHVTDSTNTGINGATVSDGLGRHTSTLATPDDPTTGDGLYSLFSPAGAQQITATMHGFIDRTAPVTVSPDQISKQEFTLTRTPA